MAKRDNENEKKITLMLLNNVLSMPEITFLTKRAMFHPLKQRGCFWMEDNIYIYIYIIYWSYN